jgi:hypothetical protein
MHPFGEQDAESMVLEGRRADARLFERFYAERLFERIVQVAREPTTKSSPAWRKEASPDLKVIQGWTMAPHASWTIVEAFPSHEMAGQGPFRQQSTVGEGWEWTAPESWKGVVEVLDQTPYASFPSRIVVRGGWLYAAEVGTDLVGMLPLDALREVSDATSTVDRFRFGRATDVILPKDSEAARRLRELLESKGNESMGKRELTHDASRARERGIL